MTGLQIVLMQVWTGLCQKLKGPKCSTVAPRASGPPTHTHVQRSCTCVNVCNVTFNSMRQSGVIFKYQMAILKIALTLPSHCWLQVKT